MEAFRKKIQQMTGWSDTVVNAIQCEAEARIYIGAGPPNRPKLSDAGMVDKGTWGKVARMDKQRLNGRRLSSTRREWRPIRAAPYRATDRFASCRTDLVATPGRGKLCGAAYYRRLLGH